MFTNAQEKPAAPETAALPSVDEDELKQLRNSLEQCNQAKAQSDEQSQALRDELAQLQQSYDALQQAAQPADREAVPQSPTVEHTAKIIADILIQARDGGEQILAKATTDAENLVNNAREKAAAFEAEAREKANRARDVFEESQRKITESQQRIQEAYSFLRNFPEQFGEQSQ